MDSVSADLLLAQNGDEKAFARFVVATEPDVRKFCQWQNRGASDVDELIQETYLKAFRKIHSYSYEATAKSWLLTIARNTCIDVFRREQRIMKRIESLAVLHRDCSEQNSENVEVEQLVNQLPDVYREAFVLVRIFGFDYAEAARILKCPKGTVQSRVARARELLVDSLQSDEIRKIS